MDEDHVQVKCMEQSFLKEIEVWRRSKNAELQASNTKTNKVSDKESHRNRSESHRIENGQTMCMDEILGILYPLSYSYHAIPNSSPPKTKDTTADVDSQPELFGNASNQKPNKSGSLENNKLTNSPTVVEFMDHNDLSLEIHNQDKQEASESCPSPKNLVAGPTVCRLCGKLVENYWGHIEKDHKKPSSKQWFCVHCPKKYSSDKSLRVHYLAIHCLISYRCKKCSRQFTYRRSALRHSQRVECDQFVS